MNETALAYHEAGHAVVSHMLKIEVVSATIIPGKDEESGIETGGHVHWIAKMDDVDRWKKDAILLRRIIAACAGHIAQKKFSPESVEAFHAANDNRSIEAYALKFCSGDVEESEALANWLRISSEKLVARFWPYIEAIAKELAIRKTLSKSEMVEIVQSLGWRAMEFSVVPLKLKGVHTISSADITKPA